MYPSPKNLKLFQKYYIHHVIALLFLCASFFLSAHLVDLSIKIKLITAAKTWLNSGEILQQHYDVYIEYIKSSYFEGCSEALFVIIIAQTAIYFCIRYFYSQFFVANTNLDEACEFSDAFKTIGCIHPNECIAFACKDKIPLYKSGTSLLHSNEKNITAKLLPYHVYFLFPNSLILRLIGERKLCLAKKDYDEILNKHEKVFEESINAEILKYKELLAENTLQLEKTKAENTQLHEKIDYLTKSVIKESKKYNSAAIEGKQASSDASRFDFFRIAIPVIDKMTQTFTGQKYTRSDIQVFFFKELDSQPKYTEAIYASAVDKNGNLRAWATEALRKKLGDMTETEGGRPRKSNKADSG